MKIGIMGAMLEEVQHIRERMDVRGERSIGGRTFYHGTLGDHDVVLVFSRWGKVASATTATTLIHCFDVDYLLFTGVAGAVDDKLNIGDVVIARGLYQHDMDARPIFERFQIPLTQTTLFHTNAAFGDKAVQASERYFNQSLSELGQERLSKFSIHSPKVRGGVVASGDQFISEKSACDALCMNGQHVLAVEMEGAAVAQVCDDYDIPLTVIRTISDKADHSAQIDFQAFVGEVASEISAGITLNLLDALSE